MIGLSLWKGEIEISPSRPLPTRMRLIAQAVAEKHGVGVPDLFGPVRFGRIARARQEAMYEVRRQTGWSYPRIGQLFGRHHSTVMDAERAHAKRLAA